MTRIVEKTPLPKVYQVVIHDKRNILKTTGLEIHFISW